MKHLIVNADDLGADQGRNDGIYQAIEAGIVTSVSILANGPSLEDVLDRSDFLHSNHVSLGLHLNLSEGKPLSTHPRLLTGQDGSFLGKASAHRLLMRQGDKALEEEIKRELEVQIMALRKEGIRIQHLDGHQHVHVFPAALEKVMQVAKEQEIPWLRVPDEPYPSFFTDSLRASLAEEARFFSGLAQNARAGLTGNAVRTTDHFRGLYFKGRLSLPLLQELVHTLPHGFTELMVHPGRSPITFPSGPFSGFSTVDREKELEALLSHSFRRAVMEDEVTLTPFPEV